MLIVFSSGTTRWYQPRCPRALLAGNDQLPYHVRELARLTVERNKILATDLLKKGMMKGKTDQEVADLISKISSANGYKSHGAVIDYGEAKAIGLDVDYLEPADPIWSRLWLLYCMYDYDSKARNLGKIFEGAYYSIGRPK
jgi:hypothetical protein